MGAYVWRGFVVFLFVFASYIFVFKIGEQDEEVEDKRQKRSPVDEMVQSEVDKMWRDDVTLHQIIWSVIPFEY